MEYLSLGVCSGDVIGPAARVPIRCRAVPDAWGRPRLSAYNDGFPLCIRELRLPVTTGLIVRREDISTAIPV